MPDAIPSNPLHTSRLVDHDEARACIQRLINSAFKNGQEGMRASIPARPDEDDDLLACAYIEQRRAAEAVRLNDLVEKMVTDLAWDDDMKRMAGYALAVVSFLIGAKESGGGAQEDATLRFVLRKPEEVEQFNRLLGDIVCGPIPANPNIVDRLSAENARLREELAESNKLLRLSSEQCVDLEQAVMKAESALKRAVPEAPSDRMKAVMDRTDTFTKLVFDAVASHRELRPFAEDVLLLAGSSAEAPKPAPSGERWKLCECGWKGRESQLVDDGLLGLLVCPRCGNDDGTKLDTVRDPEPPAAAAEPTFADGIEKPALIWSGEHHAWWRPDGAGYTNDIRAAGVYDHADAIARTSHCGPEKKIEINRIFSLESLLCAHQGGTVGSMIAQSLHAKQVLSLLPPSAATPPQTQE